MKKQTKIAAVLSAAAFMMMVSGLPVYAASYGWVTEGDAKVYFSENSVADLLNTGFYSSHSLSPLCCDFFNSCI